VLVCTTLVSFVLMYFVNRRVMGAAAVQAPQPMQSETRQES
jgi:hypothetical protein